MNLNKILWTEDNINDFQIYLKTLGNKEKEAWTKKIINTNLPVLAIKSKSVKEVVKEISKGNYLSFLDLMVWQYYENTIINGSLISKIKDFKTLKKYLDIYSNKADNWATCDILSFNIKNNEPNFIDLTLEYIKSPKPFRRRIGIVILFHFVNDKEYLPKIFDILNSFKDEEDYYVNMVNAWLVCECFIKHRNETLEFLGNHQLNRFTINKAIQKCRDSYRVSYEDKEMLLKYKKNK